MSDRATTYEELARVEELGVFSFLNPYSYRLLRRETFANEIDGYYLDGIALVWLWNTFCSHKVKRISFDMTSLASTVFEQASARGNTVYLIGSTQAVIEKTIAVFGKRFPDLRLIGSRHGYFANECAWRETAKNVAELNPDLIVVGMGTPLQERFLLDVRSCGWSGLGFTCGGFLHQTAARGIEYYPPFMDKWNLRWLFRMFKEPRVAWRYLSDYPVGVLLFVFDILTGRTSVRVYESSRGPVMVWRREQSD